MIEYIDCDSDVDFIPDKNYDRPDYTVDDVVLVRTTDAFPFNHEIHTPLSDGVFRFERSKYFNDVLLSRLMKNFPDTFREERNKYDILCDSFRDTLHFTLNGLVQSHMYGNFEGRNYIIVEPLKNHLDDSLISLRPEDTFFEGNMVLSNAASIIISEDEFERIRNDESYSELVNFNLFVYKGSNQLEAVNKSLNLLGYDSFMISNDKYSYSSKSDSNAYKMNFFLDSLGFDSFKHFGSSYFDKVTDLEIKNHDEVSFEHLNYILDNGGISPELKDEVLYYSSYVSSNNFKELIGRVIDEVGLERLEFLTNEFNEQRRREKEALCSMSK